MNIRQTEGRRTDHHIAIVVHFSPWLLNFRLPLLLDLKRVTKRVSILTPYPSTQLRDELLSYGIDCFHYPLQRTGINPINDLKSLFSIASIFKQIQPTHILTTAIKPNIYGSLASRLLRTTQVFSLVTGLGYVFTEQASKKRYIEYITTLLYKTALAQNKKVIFQNLDDQSEFIKRGIVTESNSTIVNGSGVDLLKFSPAQLVYAGQIVFLMVARLVAEKGIKEYIEATKVIMKDHNVRAILVGPFDENPGSISPHGLKELLKDSNIEFYGELKDVRPALKECHVFVLPSYREGTPKSTLEALAMGRAVITTDAPGCRETVIDGVNGHLVPIANSMALADAMLDIIRNPNKLRSMGEESLKLAREKYDIRIINKHMMDIIFADDEWSGEVQNG